MLECALEFKRYTPGSSVLTVALRVAKYLEFSGNLCPEKIAEEGGGGVRVLLTIFGVSVWLGSPS